MSFSFEIDYDLTFKKGKIPAIQWFFINHYEGLIWRYINFYELGALKFRGNIYGLVCVRE